MRFATGSAVGALIVGLYCAGPAIAAAQDKAPAAAPDTTTVTIAGKRAAVINKVDRKVYRTDADLQSTTGSAADVLSNIPSVEVDPDGNISLRGDTSVTVLIDGKPSSQTQGVALANTLQSLSASDIQQIEVVTSPSAEFKPDGSAGIINIVTKKSRKKGNTGVVQANIGNDGRYNANASGTYNRGNLSLGGGLNIRRDARARSAHNHTTTTDPATGAVTTAQQDIHQHESRLGGAANATMDYTLNDKQAVNLSADYSTRRETVASVESDTASGASPSAYQRTGHGGGGRSSKDISGRFDQKLSHDGETLSFEAQTGQTVENNVNNYTTLYSDPAGTSSRSQQGSRDIYGVSELTADYVRPFASGAVLKLGYDGEYDQTAFDNTVANGTSTTAPLITDHASDNRFRYRQTIHAVYGTYDRKWGKLELLAGLRLEQVNLHTVQNVSGDIGGQSYGTVYPTLNLSYALSDSDTISGGFSKRVKRRDPEDLNPYINTSDPSNLRQGNPNLRPELTNSLELGYRHDANGRSYQLTGYYRKSRDGDSELLTVISPNVVLITEANLPKSQSGGVEFMTSGKLLSKLSYSLSGNLFHNEVNAQALGVAGTRSATGLNAKGSLDFQPTAKDRWQVSVNSNGKRLTAQGYVLPVTTVNLGYRRDLTPKIALVATVADLFDTQKQRRLYETPTFRGIYERQQFGRIAYLGLVYTFGGPKAKRDAAFSYDQ